tara:strand:+ start:1460 stop:2269 length:810 start_codon:yes stop_codon:yes gene_type:complete
MEHKYIILIFTLLIVSLFINKKKNSNKDKLTVIIPIRDRERQLKQLLPKLINLLEYQRFNYNILIIEQSKGKSFNKGKLNNSAFLEAIKLFNPKHILFTDVDNIPLKKDSYNIDLYNDIMFKHYYGYKNCLGGIFSCSKETFYKINGFSNNYWGWGQEDDDLNYRARLMNIQIDRDELLLLNSYKRHERTRQALEMGILDIEHDGEKVKHNLKSEEQINYNREVYNNRLNKYKKNKYYIFADGIDQCNYRIIKKELIPKYKAIRILVDI